MKRGRKSVRVAVAFVRWKQAHSVSKLIWINKLISISTHRVTRFQSISYCSCSWENILPKFSSYLQVEERREKRIIERNQLDEPRETSPAFVISMNPLKTQKKRVSHMPSNDDTKAKQRWKKNCHNFYVMISRSKISDNFFVTNLIFFFLYLNSFIRDERWINLLITYVCGCRPAFVGLPYSSAHVNIRNAYQARSCEKENWQFSTEELTTWKRLSKAVEFSHLQIIRYGLSNCLMS